MRYTSLSLIFAVTSAIFTLFTAPSFAQTPVSEETDNSANLEKSVSTTNTVGEENPSNSNGIAQVEDAESGKKPQPAVSNRIPIQSRVFTAPIMQQ